MNPDTVIGRFVWAVADTLRAQGAEGAGTKVLDAALTLEPLGRGDERGGEVERLLQLARRAVDVWVPDAVSALSEPDLLLLAEQLPTPTLTDDVAYAAQALRQLRLTLRGRPQGLPPVSPVEVSGATGPLQRLLDDFEDNNDPSARGRLGALAGQGLARCFSAGATLGANGIPGEVATTVAVLEGRSETTSAVFGSAGLERTASEGNTHHSLVGELVSILAQEYGVVEWADGIGTHPRPPRIGRHRPDAIARTPVGVRVVGEAKRGPELREPHTMEQISDFLDFAHRDRSQVVMIVPGGWRGEVESVAAECGADTSRLRVIELRGLPGADRPEVSER